MNCPLVLIEWEDSSQPIARWQFLSDVDLPGAIRISSVGWLVHDDEKMKALAPNIGGANDDSMQASGIIQIPTRCVVKITKLKEPRRVA